MTNKAAVCVRRDGGTAYYDIGGPFTACVRTWIDWKFTTVVGYEYGKEIFRSKHKTSSHVEALKACGCEKVEFKV